MGLGNCKWGVPQGSECTIWKLPPSKGYWTSNLEYSTSSDIPEDWFRGNSRSCFGCSVSSPTSLVRMSCWSVSSTINCCCWCHSIVAVSDTIRSPSVSGEVRIFIAMFAWDSGGNNKAREQHETIGWKPKRLLQAYPWKSSTSPNEGTIYFWIPFHFKYSIFSHCYVGLEPILCSIDQTLYSIKNFYFVCWGRVLVDERGDGGSKVS